MHITNNLKKIQWKQPRRLAGARQIRTSRLLGLTPSLDATIFLPCPSTPMMPFEQKLKVIIMHLYLTRVTISSRLHIFPFSIGFSTPIWPWYQPRFPWLPKLSYNAENTYLSRSCFFRYNDFGTVYRNHIGKGVVNVQLPPHFCHWV